MSFPRTHAAVKLLVFGPCRRRASTRRFRVRPAIEFLENRCVPSVAPVWVPQGPGPTTQGQVQGMPLQNNPGTGAINTFALDANNAKVAPTGAATGVIRGAVNTHSPDCM